jgi:hypothetical protein
LVKREEANRKGGRKEGQPQVSQSLMTLLLSGGGRLAGG